MENNSIIQGSDYNTVADSANNYVKDVTNAKNIARRLFCSQKAEQIHTRHFHNAVEFSDQSLVN